MSNNNNIELIVLTKELSHILSFAMSVVEKRNVASELSNVKLVAKDGMLEVGATDLDLYLNQTMGAEVIFEGHTTVSTQLFSDIVKKIPDLEIKLKQEVGSDYLQIITNSCKFDLLTLPITKFPLMEDIDSVSSLTVSCSDLARIIEYTSFAMSNEETRYNLNGIYLNVKDDEFVSVATDAHRVSVASSSINSNGNDFGVIIPKKTVNELIKIVRDSKNINTDVSISLSANKVKFRCNNLILISKLIDGTFPDYHSFIPLNNENKLTISTKLLANAIDRVSSVTVDKFRAIKIALDDKYLTITASGEAKGAGTEVIEFSEDKEKYCNFTGVPMIIGFNSKYIMDVLGALKENQVNLYLSDPGSPVLIKTTQNPKDNFVVMPVKV